MGGREEGWGCRGDRIGRNIPILTTSSKSVTAMRRRTREEKGRIMKVKAGRWRRQVGREARRRNEKCIEGSVRHGDDRDKAYETVRCPCQ